MVLRLISKEMGVQWVYTVHSSINRGDSERESIYRDMKILVKLYIYIYIYIYIFIYLYIRTQDTSRKGTRCIGDFYIYRETDSIDNELVCVIIVSVIIRYIYTTCCWRHTGNERYSCRVRSLVY